MTALRAERPRAECAARSSGPAYASVSTMRPTIGPSGDQWTRRLPRRSGATSSDGRSNQARSEMSGPIGSTAATVLHVEEPGDVGWDERPCQVPRHRDHRLAEDPHQDRVVQRLPVALQPAGLARVEAGLPRLADVPEERVEDDELQDDEGRGERDPKQGSADLVELLEDRQPGGAG